MKDARSEREIVIEPSAGAPLMVVSKGVLRTEIIARIKEAFERLYRGGDTDHRVVVVDASLEVFQLRDGQWQKIE